MPPWRSPRRRNRHAAQRGDQHQRTLHQIGDRARSGSMPRAQWVSNEIMASASRRSRITMSKAIAGEDVEFERPRRPGETRSPRRGRGTWTHRPWSGELFRIGSVDLAARSTGRLVLGMVISPGQRNGRRRAGNVLGDLEQARRQSFQRRGRGRSRRGRAPRNGWSAATRAGPSPRRASGHPFASPSAR